MFFRRPAPHHFTFEERIRNAAAAKFDAHPEGSGRMLITRGAIGAIVEDKGNGDVKIGQAGVMIGPEIGELVNRGYQMFLRTPSGKEIPAQAKHLHALHAFDEDLREAIGLTSLYNVSLGTTTSAHLYDRVEERDAPPHHHPWEK
jgi:hypothetical protein